MKLQSLIFAAILATVSASASAAGGIEVSAGAGALFYDGARGNHPVLSAGVTADAEDGVSRYGVRFEHMNAQTLVTNAGAVEVSVDNLSCTYERMIDETVFVGAKAGLAQVRTRTTGFSDVSSRLSMGVSAGYRFTPAIAVRAEVSTLGRGETLNSISAAFRF